jgi:quercetin dioxygenase-like cupin family protein
MAAQAGALSSGDARAVEMFGGALVRRTLAVGDRMLLAEFRAAKGGVVPPHQHDFEQVGYLASGRAEFTIGGRKHVIEPGGGYTIPAGVVHGAEVLEESVIVEVFSPPRDDYRE